LFGLRVVCWRCGCSTTAAVGLLPDTGVRSDLGDLLLCEHEEVMSLAVAVLPEQARLSGEVGRIRSRYSRTVGGSYLANGCFHCDALLGNFLLFSEELPQALAEYGPEVLVEIARADAPLARVATLPDREYASAREVLGLLADTDDGEFTAADIVPDAAAVAGADEDQVEITPAYDAWWARVPAERAVSVSYPTYNLELAGWDRQSTWGWTRRENPSTRSSPGTRIPGRRCTENLATSTPTRLL
jgi:hypothetical protein